MDLELNLQSPQNIVCHQHLCRECDRVSTLSICKECLKQKRDILTRTSLTASSMILGGLIPIFSGVLVFSLSSGLIFGGLTGLIYDLVQKLK